MTIATTHAALYVEPSSDMYAADVAKRELLGVQKARETFATRVDLTAAPDPVHTVVAKRGVPKSVLVPIEWYRRAAECLGDPTEY